MFERPFRAAFTILWLLYGVSPVRQVTAAERLPRTWHVSPESLKGLPREKQLPTISEAAARVEPGDTVVIHAGIYRESVAVKQNGTPERPIRFEAAAGERVVITGADQVGGWRKESKPDLFSAPWTHRFIGWSRTGAHPDDELHRMIGRCEQVFIAGVPLIQVLEHEAITRGTFYVDLEARRIYVSPRDGADLTKGNHSPVEASARSILWEVTGGHVQLRGLRFRYAANMAQQGAARFAGDHGLIEDCIFESTNSSGASFVANDLTVRRCVFQDNGQLGFSAARAHNLLLTGCLVRNNNVKGFDRGWEAGGNKLVLCRNATLEGCQFVANRGHGVWFDIGNEACEVRQCLISENEDAGIFYEISFGLKAHDNVIIDNGYAETPGSWGAAAGIALSSSPGCVVERNLLLGNREGLALREQIRTTPRIDDKREQPVWNHDELIRHNVVAWNRDAQVRGWFDIDDGRHWSAALRDATEQRAAAKGFPAGMTLEKLAIRFEGNFYDAKPWQRLFVWGAEWKRHRSYDRLEDVRSELGFEREGQAGELRVANPADRDFRVPPDSRVIERRCYPQGSVPGATLGPLAP